MDDSPLQSALCVIGHPIGGNPAQFVIQRALAALRIDWTFSSFDVPDPSLLAAIEGIEALGYRGGLIADPHQHRVAQWFAERGCDPSHSPDPPMASGDVADATIRRVDGVARGDDGRLRPCDFIRDALEEALGRSSDPPGGYLLCGPRDPEPSILHALQFVFPQTGYRLSGDHARCLTSDDSPRWEQQVESPFLLVTGSRGPTTRMRGSDEVAQSRESIREVLAKAHPGSICLDLVFTPTQCQQILGDAQSPLVRISQTDLEVLRLARAVHRWTGRPAPVDVMGEAIEEYLEL